MLGLIRALIYRTRSSKSSPWNRKSSNLVKWMKSLVIPAFEQQVLMPLVLVMISPNVSHQH